MGSPSISFLDINFEYLSHQINEAGVPHAFEDLDKQNSFVCMGHHSEKFVVPLGDIHHDRGLSLVGHNIVSFVQFLSF